MKLRYWLLLGGLGYLIWRSRQEAVAAPPTPPAAPPVPVPTPYPPTPVPTEGVTPAEELPTPPVSDLVIYEPEPLPISPSVPTTQPAPPEQGIVKVQTGRDHVTQRTSIVIFQGRQYTVNDHAGEILQFNVSPGTYTVSFGEAYHPVVRYTTPSPVTRSVRAGEKVLFFGLWRYIPEASSPCGCKGTVNKRVKTGRKVLTNRGLVDEYVLEGISGLKIYCWWPAQRNIYNAPIYPGAPQFNPELFYTTVTGSEGEFYFRGLPIPEEPRRYYCIGTDLVPGYSGAGGERQIGVVPGSLEVMEINISKRIEPTLEEQVEAARTYISRMVRAGSIRL